MKDIKNFDAYLTDIGYNRVNLITQPSPLIHLKSLSEEIGTPIYIKREDLLEIGTGGNKLRKLEYLLAQAKYQQANRIITVGARQSNHARLTAITASRLGFDVDLILKNSVSVKTDSYRSNGNIVLDKIVDATIHEIANDERVPYFITDLINSYTSLDDKVYFIPVGGSNTVGGLGYTRVSYEIEQQAEELGVKFQHIATASGSGGTHGGLIAGYSIMQRPININAYNVQLERNSLLLETKSIVEGVLNLFNFTELSTDLTYNLSNDYVGEGYGLVNKDTLETIKFLAKKEGVLLDPVYTGKAFTGLLKDISLGKYPKGEPILFLHTGGTAGLFAYNHLF